MEKRWYSVTLPVLLMLAIAFLGFGCDDETGVLPIVDGDKTVEDGDVIADGDEDVVKPDDNAPCDTDEDCQDGETCVDLSCRVACEDSSVCQSDEICLGGICEANCDNRCIAEDGYYCDYETQLCKMVDCEPCTQDLNVFYCGSDGSQSCTAITDNGNNGSYCLAKVVDSTCPEGFSPSADNKCHPKAKCKGAVEAEEKFATEYPGSPPGGGCEFGPLFPGRSCAAGGSCIGNGSLGEPCDTTEDCQLWSQSYSNITADVVYCAGGSCGFAFCVTPCNSNGACPSLEGLEDLTLYPDTVSGSCYCGPDPLFEAKGTAPVGSICNPGYQDDLPLCADGLQCVALTQDTTCSTNSDCSAFGDNGYCASTGKCAISYCTSGCVDDKCEDGQNFVPMQNKCMCTLDTLAPTGNVAADGKCDGGFKDELDNCQAGLHCRVWTDGFSTECTEDTDCSEAEWGPNAFCNDSGYCSYSLCATPCTDGACPDGTSRLKEGPVNLCVCTGNATYGTAD